MWQCSNLVWTGKRPRINVLLNYFDYKICYKRAIMPTILDIMH